YCAKCSTNSGLQFKVHGEFPLRNIQIEDGNAHISVENSFTIHCSKRSLLLCAVNVEEKTKWMQDLNEAVEKAKNSEPNANISPKLSDQKSNYSTLKSNSSSDNNLDLSNEEDQASGQNIQHRANTTMHVCWHRNTSVGTNDIHRSNLNQLSGYLLRKFKNSNGWQKLWVVFTNFCLFFYKTYHDEYPLASLPLLGYSVTVPSESDSINKDFVFKLQFKNHVYFFRTESQYSFDRWLEVTESAVQKKCLFN
ncbi:pleckstrin domain-containing 2, partial [Brachionus plicatilis]